MTTITGTLYNARGVAVTQGKLTLTLQQDMVTAAGAKVAPISVTVDLEATSGVVNVSVYPTIGSSPANLAYFVEFDPNPADTTKPARLKDGYWYNYWSVPDTASVTLGSFTPALRGTPNYSYLPVRPAAGQNNSTANDVATLRSDFNALLAKLRAGNVIAS